MGLGSSGTGGSGLVSSVCYKFFDTIKFQEGKKNQAVEITNKTNWLLHSIPAPKLFVHKPHLFLVRPIYASTKIQLSPI